MICEEFPGKGNKTKSKDVGSHHIELWNGYDGARGQTLMSGGYIVVFKDNVEIDEYRYDGYSEAEFDYEKMTDQLVFSNWTRHGIFVRNKHTGEKYLSL